MPTIPLAPTQRLFIERIIYWDWWIQLYGILDGTYLLIHQAFPTITFRIYTVTMTAWDLTCNNTNTITQVVDFNSTYSTATATVPPDTLVLHLLTT